VSAAITAAFVVALCAAQDGGTPPSPAPAVAPPAPLVAATFYAWYDHPGAHFVDASGRDLLRDHFVDPELVHADSPDWFAGELADAADAGLDVLLCASVDAATAWPAALGTALERTRGRLARPIRAALLVEPWCLAAKRDGGFDLDDEATRAATLAAILDFHRALRPEDWAQLDGAPLVAFGRVSGGGDGGKNGPAPAAFFAELRARFREEFGRAPSLLVDRSWNRDGQPPQGDRTWREGAAILGPQLGTVASIAPGYDDRQLEKPLGVVRPREGGRVYEQAWQQLLSAPHELVVVESWNQFHDGTAIAPSLERGRSDVARTRRWSERLRSGAVAGAPIATRFDGPVGAADFGEDRCFSTHDEVAYRPGDEEGGIALSPKSRARLAFAESADGEILDARTRTSGTRVDLRFDVNEAFPLAGIDAVDVVVRFSAPEGRRKVTLLGRVQPIDFDPPPQDPDSASLLPAGETVVEAGASCEARFQIPDLSSAFGRPRHDFMLRFEGGPIVLREVVLRRKQFRLTDEKGVPAPLRRLPLHWSDSEGPEGRLDEAKLRSALGLAREGEPADRDGPRVCGVVVLDRPPASVIPIGQHADAIAEMVGRVVAAMAEDPSLRLLELFPRANRDGVVAKVAEVEGYVRVLRAAARAAHAVAPNVALVLGAIEGPDVPWLRTIQGMKQPFTYDAATFEWTAESGTPGDATCEREFERMLTQWRAGGDGEKPFLVTRGGWLGQPAPDRAPATMGAPVLLPPLLRSAWRRLGRSPGRVAVLDEESLPLVRGLPATRVVEALNVDGLDAFVKNTPELAGALADGECATVVLAQGDLFPEELAPRLTPYIDRGGMLVCLGGAPFRRPAARAADGGFTLRDESPVGMTLRDDLRIELAPYGDPELLRVTVPETAAELSPLRGTPLAVATTFVRRAGRPRDLQGFHRFEPLLGVDRRGAPIGTVAALVTYSAGRKGGLLLIGVDGGGRIVDATRAQEIEAAMHVLARKHHALASFVLPADDAH